jgi:hypothetical protein
LSKPSARPPARASDPLEDLSGNVEAIRSQLQATFSSASLLCSAEVSVAEPQSSSHVCHAHAGVWVCVCVCVYVNDGMYVDVDDGMKCGCGRIVCMCVFVLLYTSLPIPHSLFVSFLLLPFDLLTAFCVSFFSCTYSLHTGGRGGDADHCTVAAARSGTGGTREALATRQHTGLRADRSSNRALVGHLGEGSERPTSGGEHSTD